MSSQRQIDANRENAQKSTGPTSTDGLKRSSRNANKHGFTGQSLILSPEETELYNAFVADYYNDFCPYDAVTKQLTQQLADAHWSIQQIFVQQTNLMALINAATNQLSEAGDPIAALTTLGPLTKTLQTYTTYENRRRRAADAIETKLTHPARTTHRTPQSRNSPSRQARETAHFTRLDFHSRRFWVRLFRRRCRAVPQG